MNKHTDQLEKMSFWSASSICTQNASAYGSCNFGSWEVETDFGETKSGKENNTIGWCLDFDAEVDNHNQLKLPGIEHLSRRAQSRIARRQRTLKEALKLNEPFKMYTIFWQILTECKRIAELFDIILLI